MANSTVTAVYRFVIDDVITNVRRDFEDMGVDETIMHELQRSWEAKIAQSRVTAFQAPEAAGSVETYPFEEPSTYEQAAPAAAAATSIALPPVALPGPSGPSRARPAPPVAVPGLPQSYVPAHVSQPYSAPLPPVNFNYRNETTPAANLANVASSTLPGESGNAGRPQAHAPPRNNRNIALPGGGRNGQADHDDNIPQTDGATESSLEFMTTAEMDAYVERRFREAQGDDGEVTFTLTLSDRAARKARRDGGAGLEMLGVSIGQVDGEDDDEGGAVDDADLGSDLDDSDGEIDEESDNIVLCQYDKVSRTKNKWKCVLKDGIMLINGRDYLFHKATGDFEW